MNVRIATGILFATGLLSLATAASASDHFTKQLTLAPGGRFVLESEEGGVAVVGTDQPGASIAVTGNRDDLESYFDFKFEENAGEVRVRVRRHWHSDWFFSFDNAHLYFEVRVPKSTSLEIRTGGGRIDVRSMSGEAELSTSGGPIDVTGLAGRLRAHTSGGHIHAQDVQGDATLETSGGGIEAESIEGSLIARTSGGGIRIQRVAGRLEAFTSGGEIVASLTKKNQHGGSIESSGGSIAVSLDPSTNLSIDASTSGGRVVSDVPIRTVGVVSSDSLRGTLGSGGETLRMHTSGGWIRIGSI